MRCDRRDAVIKSQRHTNPHSVLLGLYCWQVSGDPHRRIDVLQWPVCLRLVFNSNYKPWRPTRFGGCAVMQGAHRVMGLDKQC